MRSVKTLRQQVLVALAVVIGCALPAEAIASGIHRCKRPICPPYHAECFGYHSTCWRPWPVNCPTCPPYLAPRPEFAAPVPLPVISSRTPQEGPTRTVSVKPGEGVRFGTPTGFVPR